MSLYLINLSELPNDEEFALIHSCADFFSMALDFVV